MRYKYKGIERAMAEAEAKSRAEYGMRKQVWRAKSLGLRNSTNSSAEIRGVKPDKKSAVGEAQAKAKAKMI